MITPAKTSAWLWPLSLLGLRNLASGVSSESVTVTLANPKDFAWQGTCVEVKV